MIGSPPLLSTVTRTLIAAGARSAEPGEFTLRAFLAGRIDLTQSEAVLGVIDARGDDELREALARMAGGLARPLDALRGELLDLLAELEAGLDFVEEDIQFISPQEIDARLSAAAEAVECVRRQIGSRVRSDNLVRVVLVGSPNVGKSSLFNALASESAALVSDVPGTTRDYLTAMVDLGSTRCQLVDTAGVEPEHAGGSIAGQAQRLTASQSESCEVRLVCIDASRPLDPQERTLLAAGDAARRLIVLTKCDCRRAAELSEPAIETSAASGLGLDRLRRALREVVVAFERNETSAGATVERCSESLILASEAIAQRQPVESRSRRPGTDRTGAATSAG